MSIRMSPSVDFRVASRWPLGASNALTVLMPSHPIMPTLTAPSHAAHRLSILCVAATSLPLSEHLLPLSSPSFSSSSSSPSSSLSATPPTAARRCGPSPTAAPLLLLSVSFFPLPTMSSAVNCPVLKVPELVLCLADMHVHITADDIKQPNPTTTRHIFEVFVDKLMGIKREELHQPQFHAIHLLSNPELHEDSLAEVTTLKAILRLLRAAGVSDASMSDVCEPTYVRMKMILSCLINLIKHREDVLEHYTHYSHQWEVQLQQRLTLEEEVARLQDERDRLRPQYEQDAAAVESLTADIAALTSSITSYNQQHLAIRDDIRQAKAELKGATEAAHTSKQSIAALQKDNAVQRQHILRSPERLKRTLADLTNLVQQGKADVQEGSTKCRELGSRALLLNKVEGRLKKRLGAMRDIEQLQGKSAAAAVAGQGVRAQHCAPARGGGAAQGGGGGGGSEGGRGGGEGCGAEEELRAEEDGGAHGAGGGGGGVGGGEGEGEGRGGEAGGGGEGAGAGEEGGGGGEGAA